MRDSNQEMRFKNFLNFIVQCWDALEDQRGFHKDKLDRHERLGEALAHAGVAITITSITDIIAFGVGGTTVSQNLKINFAPLFLMLIYSLTIQSNFNCIFLGITSINVLLPLCICGNSCNLLFSNNFFCGLF